MGVTISHSFDRITVSEDRASTDSGDYTTVSGGSNAGSCADSVDSEDNTTADEDITNDSSLGTNIPSVAEYSATISSGTATTSSVPSQQTPSTQPSSPAPPFSHQPQVSSYSLSQAQPSLYNQLPPFSTQPSCQSASIQHFIIQDTPEKRALCQLSKELVLAISASGPMIQWELFAKGLIEQETCEKCLLEIFTQTEKSSRIVMDLIKKVSAVPNLLETLVSVLRESGNIALMSVGELLEQTFKCELLLGTPCHSHSFHTHPPRPPQLQSPICRYANHLRAVYERFELSNPAFYKWMCSPGEKFKFINLAVISKKKLNKEEAEKIKKETIHGHIDVILKKKAPIAIENILQVEQGSLSCVLIEGAPGVGKSTLACEVCRRWGRGELFQEYSIVLLVTLRDERVQRATCVVDLFYHSNKKLQEEVVEEIGESNGKGTLLLLDGLDELPKHLLTEYSIFTDILSGSKFPEATVLVTSRPSATNKLWPKWWQKISRHIEILGFKEDNIDEYSQSVLSDHQLLGFKNYLSIHPHIKSMMYVPLHCAIATTVYLQCQHSDRFPPKTLTGLYTCLAQTILIQYLQDHPDYKDSEYQFDSFSELPPLVYSHFKKICNLAFDGVDKQLLVYRNLPQSLDQLGFMNAVPERLLKSASYSYNFLHLSVQEYLAAYHISLMSHQDQEQLLQTVRYGDHYFNMTRFLAGITQFKHLDKEVVKKVIGLGHDRDEHDDHYYGFYDLETEELSMSNYTLEFLYECQDVSILDQHCCYKVNIQSTDSAHHLTALEYCIANSSSAWHTTFTDRDSSETEVLWERLRNCTHPNYSIKYIKFKACDPEFILQALQYLPEYALLQIEELSIKHGGLPPCLSEQIIRMKRLTTLTVDNVLQTSLIYLIPALSGVRNLRDVWIYGENWNFKLLLPSDNLYSISGTLISIDQFLPNLPQQTITHIGSLKIQHLHKDYQLLPLPSCLPEIISRMERLNTLKLVNIDISLTQLLPTLRKVPTLRIIALHKLKLEDITGLCQWLHEPSCQLELLTLYEEIGAEASQKMIINFSTVIIKTIECQYSTKIFIDQILTQLPQEYLMHIKTVTVHNKKSLNFVQDSVYVYEDKDEDEQEYGEEREYEEEQEYEYEDDYEYEDEYEYDDDYEYDDYEDEHEYDENEAADDESAHKTRDDESKAENESSDRDEDNYQLLPCLPELIPRMESLNTLTLTNVSFTSLTELMPLLPRVSTLRNLQVNNSFEMHNSTGTITSVSYTQKFLDQLLFALPQKSIAEIEILTLTYGDKYRCSSYDSEQQHCLSVLIPRMRLNTLTVTNALDSSLAKIIPALYRVPTMRNLTLHKLDSDSITLLCQWLPTCQLETLTLVETLNTHKMTMIFCNNLLEIIECQHTTAEFTDHILKQIPQQCMKHINTLTIDNETYGYDDYGDYDQLKPPISIPSSLHELIPRMEKLNTLTLKNALDTSLIELVLKLSRVSTLRNLTLHELNSEGITLLCKWLPTYQLKTLKLYEHMFAATDRDNNYPIYIHRLITINFCNKYIEAIEGLQCTTGFISHILTQIPQQCTAYAKTLTIDNSSDNEYTPPQPFTIPSCMLDHFQKMKRLNTLTLKSVLAASLVELIPVLYSIPTLRYLTLHEVNSNGLALLCQWLPKCQLETLKIIHDNLGNVTIKLCSEHVEAIKCQYRKTEFIDQILTQTQLQSILTLVINNESETPDYEYEYYDNDPLPIPPSLPELISTMERLTTLTLKNVTDTSLTKFIPALYKIPTLKNLTLSKLNSEGITLLCQWLQTCQLETLEIPQKDSCAITFTYDNKSVETIVCHYCTMEFICQILTQMSQQSLTQVKSLTVCNEEFEEYMHIPIDPQALPGCLTELILTMERLNTLTLEYILATSLLPFLHRVPTLRKLTLAELNSEGITLVCQWLPTSRLESLTLPCLSPDHIGIVSRAATKILSLKAFNIRGSKFTPLSMQDLASMLKQSQSLTELNISSCTIDSDCVRCLAEALYQNTTLKRLNMSENSVGEKGALAVAEMLERNTALEELDLSNARINSCGSIAIAEALNHSTVLRKIYGIQLEGGQLD